MRAFLFNNLLLSLSMRQMNMAANATVHMWRSEDNLVGVELFTFLSVPGIEVMLASQVLFTCWATSLDPLRDNLDGVNLSGKIGPNCGHHPMCCGPEMNKKKVN